MKAFDKHLCCVTTITSCLLLLHSTFIFISQLFAVRFRSKTSLFWVAQQSGQFYVVMLLNVRGAMQDTDESGPVFERADGMVRGQSKDSTDGLNNITMLNKAFVVTKSYCEVVGLTCSVCVLSEMESVKMARVVFNRLFETCCLWQKELPFCRRPQPYYETSIHAIKNMRRKMEDKHVIIPDFNTLFNIQVNITSFFVSRNGSNETCSPRLLWLICKY